VNDEELHARLTEALWEWRGPETAVSNAFLASRLLPVVRQLINSGAAEAERRGYELGRREFAEYLSRVYAEARADAPRGKAGR
jgi:hypothetical protein